MYPGRSSGDRSVHSRFRRSGDDSGVPLAGRPSVARSVGRRSGDRSAQILSRRSRDGSDLPCAGRSPCHRGSDRSDEGPTRFAPRGICCGFLVSVVV